MAYTTPKQYAIEEATSTDLNTYQRDNIAHIHDRPACIVTHNTTQSSSAGGFVTLAFNTEQKDTDAMHSTVTNNSRINLVESGLWVVTSNVAISNPGTDHTLTLIINHSPDAINNSPGQSCTSSGSTMSLSVTKWIYTELTSTYVETMFFQSAGTTSNVILSTTDRFPYMSAVKVRDVL